MRYRILTLLALFYLILDISVPVAAQTDSDLRDFLSDPTCRRTCYLGIEPGVTTQSEVQDILTANGITYLVGKAPWEAESDAGYGWTPDGAQSLVSDSFPGVAIQFQESIVIAVTLMIDEIPLHIVIDAYGYPTEIVRSSIGSHALLYPSEGLTFLITEIAEDVYDTVDFVHLLPPDDVALIYSWPISLPDLPDCQPEVLCSIPISDPCYATVLRNDTPALLTAITSANTTPEADTICLEAGTYTLDVPITSEITLVGLGAGAQISGTLHVSGAGRLTLRNVSVNP